MHTSDQTAKNKKQKTKNIVYINVNVLGHTFKTLLANDLGGATTLKYVAIYQSHMNVHEISFEILTHTFFLGHPV